MTYPDMFPLILYLIGGISALVIDRMSLVKNKKIMPWLVAVSIVLALPLRFYGENLLTHIMMAMAICLLGFGLANWVRNIVTERIRLLIEEVVEEKMRNAIDQ